MEQIATVRQMLDRVTEAGLVRRLGSTVAEQERFERRLIDRLAYMDGENLATLAEEIIGVAQIKRGQAIWPTEALVLSIAKTLQREPVTQKRIVTSWLASVEGPKALARGDVVELFRWLRRYERPPMPHDLRKIGEEAEENRRQVAMINDRIERGVASEADRAWLVAYRRDQEDVRRIVKAGDARRLELAQ